MTAKKPAVKKPATKPAKKPAKVAKARYLLFTAAWCGPCKNLKKATPAALFSQLEVVDVDTDPGNDLLNEFDVCSLPTILRVVGGKKVAYLLGYSKKHGQAALKRFLAGGDGTTDV